MEDGKVLNADDNATSRSWRKDEKENDLPKSHGIPPKGFYRKRNQLDTSPQLQEHWETVETNLLTLEKQEHSQKLEARRKAFRRITCLKTWPLQDMAMEHLDHLLGKDSQSQFHGGDYLSSESSSSVESMDAKKRISPSKTKQEKEFHQDSVNQFETNKEPLWSQEPRIFATEKAQGKRKYLVGHFGRIADWYWRKANQKHLYEVIRESTPCRLYFDLEYSKVYNPEVDEEELLNEFREELRVEFMEHYQIKLERNQIVDLDSSTDVKFSRHWILDIPGHLFEDAPTAGRFVKRLVSRLADDSATGQLKDRRPELAEHLFVNTKEEGKTSCFIDLGVYTRNRLFRVFGSSKFGKKATLEVSSANEYPIELPPKQPPSQHISLEDYINANNWEPHARVLAKTLVVPLEQGPEYISILKVDEEKVGQSWNRVNAGKVKKYHPSIPIRMAATPLPSLDAYVADVLANRGGTQGNIRAWSVERGQRDVPISITYQLSRNRYCELVGRSHKSNNVFWTIDLSSWTCFQGCHDPDCFGRGSPVSVPEEFVKKIKAEFDAWQEEEFEKALLSLNLDEEPKTASIPKVSTTTEAMHDTEDLQRDNPIKNTPEPLAANVEKLHREETMKCPETRGDSGTLLSDEDILNAVFSSPELFP
eukprot:scaffold26366_cov117-Cylindrotheca_fusiformis.AAC.8